MNRKLFLLPLIVLLALAGTAAAQGGAGGALTGTPGIVTDESLTPSAPAAPILGNVKWLTIACKFADVADEPEPMSFFQSMYAATYPGLDHYWREVSNDHINLAGSQAIGWYTLPRNMNGYLFPNGYPDYDLLMRDCYAAADADVYFPDYGGLMSVFNSSVGRSGCSRGSIVQEGQPREYANCAIFPQYGRYPLVVIQHEMGHGYNLRHSFAQDQAYGNRWDVMSLAGYNCAAATDPVYGCVGQGIIAAARDQLGWIPAARRFVAAAGQGAPATYTVDLARTLRPPANADYLIAIIPINGSTTHYYTVEARRPVGYDAILPAGVVFHEIGGVPFSLKLMGDYGQGPDFTGDVWLPGETFVAPEGGITVSVDSADSDGYRVTITNGLPMATVTLTPSADTYVSVAAPNANFGGSATLLVSGVYSDDPTRMRAALRFNPAQLPPHPARYRLRLKIVTDSGDQWPGFAALLPATYRDSSLPWTESGLTWNTMDFPMAPNRRPVRNGAWIEWDLTQEIAGLGLQSFVVGDSESPMSFSSKEGADAPQLVVDYLVMDEPITTTFLPTNDAYVMSNKKTAVFDKPKLQVRDAAADSNSYLKFNVQGLNGAVTDATLRLWVLDGGPDGGKVYATSAFYKNTTTNWLETGLKWNNAPPIGGAPLGSIGAIVPGRWVEVDVTAAVIAAVTGSNGRVSLALSNDAANLVAYSSGEGAHPPELVVTTN